MGSLRDDQMMGAGRKKTHPTDDHVPPNTVLPYMHTGCSSPQTSLYIQEDEASSTTTESPIRPDPGTGAALDSQ